jgi:hypothetical protein
MFCPEGYETLGTAYRRCGQAASEWARTQPPIVKPKYPDLFSDAWLDEEYRSGGYREWLWTRFAWHTFNKLYCVSPTGIVLRLDVESGGFFMNPPSEFPDDIEAQKKLEELSGDIFYWIDNQGFAIRRLHDMIADEFSDPEGFQRQIMAPLIGRPVLWKPPKPTLSNQDFLNLILSDAGPSVQTQSRPRPVGRPGKGQSLELRSLVLSVFSDRYRDPLAIKKEAVLNEAQAWIRRHTGEEVGRTTIQPWLAPLWEDSAGK